MPSKRQASSTRCSPVAEPFNQISRQETIMENQTAPVANETNGPMLAIQSVYLKDCSYEAPKGPRLDGNWNPQISLDINTTAAVVAPDVNEVVLTVTVGAKQGEAT